MTERSVLLARDGAVATLTLNDGERRNPLSLALMDELIRRLDAIDADEEIRAVILAARGPAFCAGHDLSEMVGRDGDFYERLFATCGALMMRIHRIRQPVVACVEGIATAAGCQLVSACDLAVASEAARFATPGVRIGLFCSTPLTEVARDVGRKRAMEMLLVGEPIDAATAREWGLVNHVVPPGELEGAAAALAARVADASAIALGIGKRAFYDSLGMTDELYAIASAAMCRNMAADDAQEGISAFLEKRAPTWSHR